MRNKIIFYLMVVILFLATVSCNNRFGCPSKQLDQNGAPKGKFKG